MRDDELDHLLATAMQVEHSPEFLPRVRRRVEVAQATPRLEAWWRFGAGFVLSAVAIAIAAIASESHTVAPPAPAAPVLAVAKPASPIVPVTTVLGAPVERRSNADTPRAASTFPKVLISPDESRGLELAVKAARSGRLPAELLASSRSGSERLLAPLEIAPLNIEPLPGIVPLQGERP